MTTVRMLAGLVAVVALGCFEPESGVGTACPDVISDGTACRGAATCTWGGMACRCGVCNPAFGCTCADGAWQCWHTDPFPEDWCADAAQPDVPGLDSAVAPDDVSGDAAELPASCPDEPPIGVAASCDSGTRCEYGIECCCGSCYPSTVCNCAGGAWGCHATDACMIPGCPDATQDTGPSIDTPVDAG